MGFFYGENMELTKENVTLIAALGVFAGTLITALTNYIQNKNKQLHEWKAEKSRRKIEKGEQLYEALMLYKKMLFSHHMSWISCIDGHFKPHELADKIEEIERKNPEYKVVGDRIILISGVYFPEISIMFKNARELLKPANSILFKLQKGSLNDKSLSRKIILDAGSHFDKEADEIMALLSKEIRTL